MRNTLRLGPVFFSILALLGGPGLSLSGCGPKPMPAPAPVPAAGPDFGQIADSLLDAIATGDRKSARSLWGRLTPRETGRKYSSLREATSKWLEAEELGDELAALDSVIDVAKALPRGREKVPLLVVARGKLTDSIDGKVVTLVEAIEQGQEDLRCSDVKADSTRLEAIARASGRTFQAHTDTTGCEEAAGKVQAAVDAKSWAVAYEAWYVYRVQAQRRPALDNRNSMHARKASFASEFQATLREASAKKQPATTGMPGRKVLGDTPIAGLWDSSLKRYTESQAVQLVERVERSSSWNGLQANHAQVAWLVRFLRTSQIMPTSRELDSWHKSARDGKFESIRKDLGQFEQGRCRMLAAIARKTRALAASDRAAKADARTRTGDWVVAARLVGEAEALDADEPKVRSSRSGFQSTLSAARGKLVQQLRESRDPSNAGAAFDALTAIDDATDGAGKLLDSRQRERFRGVFVGYSKSKHSEVYRLVAQLDAASVDYAGDALGLIRGWTRDWALKESGNQRKQKQAQAAERLLESALQSVPSDPTLQQALGSVRVEAREERSQAAYSGTT